ncbi:hypothetical protein ACLMJK_007481 [Lecanora helva]
MSEPSQVQHPSSRPSSPQNSPTNGNERDDERVDEAVANESAPLLSSGGNTRSADGITSTKIIHTLTPIALALSAVTLILLINIAVLMSNMRNGDDMPWMTQDAMNGVIAPAILSVLIDAVNLARTRQNRPHAALAFNMLMDLVIAAFAIPYAASGLMCVTDYLDYGWGQPAVRILVGIAMAMAIVVG